MKDNYLEKPSVHLRSKAMISLADGSVLYGFVKRGDFLIGEDSKKRIIIQFEVDI